ncbi:MAG TPA: glycosyltransferase family 2 protein [Kiritimatiellia bacterium]|nr:glycosyltransferase family 2 protein [Kiritimatiellia bacterium]
MNSQISEIVSCFNEQETIEACVKSIHLALPEAEILVVDGGHDQTFEIASALIPEIPRLRVVRNLDDRGKGHAIREGCRLASGPIIAQFDADLQFFAEDLPHLIEPLLAQKCDLCVGSRFLPSADRAAYQPMFFRDLGNRLLSSLLSLLSGHRLTDVTTGMKAWTREAGERIDFTDDRYSYEAEIVLKAARRGLRILEVPVKYASRTHGQSMHQSNFALIRAGTVIALKSIGWRLREGRRSS